MKQTNSKSAMRNSKEKSSMKPKSQPPKPEMIESFTLSQQAEEVIDAEVAASHHWNEDANAAVAVKTRSGRLVVEAGAVQHSNEDAHAAATEFEHVRMGDLLWKTQQHSIRMKQRTPQLQKQSKLKADSLLKQQQHVVVMTNAAAAASKEKSEGTSYVEVARK